MPTLHDRAVERIAPLPFTARAVRCRLTYTGLMLTIRQAALAAAHACTLPNVLPELQQTACTVAWGPPLVHCFAGLGELQWWPW